MIGRLLGQGSSADRRLGRDVLWSVGSLVILGLGGVAINTLIAATLGRQALGVFNQVFAFYIVLSQLAVGGLQFSVLQQVSYNQHDKKACAAATSSALLLVAAISGLICVLVLAGRHFAGRLLDSPDVAEGLAWMAPGLLLFSLNKVLIYVLNGSRHMRAYALFQSLRFILLVVILGGLLLAGRRAAELPLALTLTELLLFVALGLYIRLRLFGLSWSGLGEWCRRHVFYGTRGVLSGILTELNTRVDILLLGYFLDDGQVGVYSFAAVLAEGFGQLAVAVRWNLDPLIGQSFAAGRFDEIAVLIRRIRRSFWPAAVGIGLAACAMYPLILRVLLPGKGLAESWAVFCILAAGLMFNAGYRPFMGLLLQGGRPGAHTALVSLIATSNLLLNLALIPLWGLVGSAFATATAFVLEALFLAAFARRRLGIKL